ncbi:hypothetical protein GCM10025868_20660 [Angustibacter aerolatus]|uniref:Uncharacterized protein n=1 Tax=Angustibacter aerolatus TaxID=1162965 RepID=A0ABQ6JF35_9ACTN|nr:hypothetical protein GCM10025868_20660 [Angustibacter aerolatus]
MGAATRLQVRPRPASRLASALGRGAPGFTLAALLVTSLLPGGSGGPVKRTALLVSLTFFFAMLVARLVVLAVRVPARRLPCRSSPSARCSGRPGRRRSPPVRRRRRASPSRPRARACT